MGAPAGGERCAVTAHEIDRLGIDAELVCHDLPKAGFVALPARLRSHDERDAACGRHPDRDALVRHAHRSFDIVGDADAEQAAALLRLPAAGDKAVPLRALPHAGEVTGTIPPVAGDPP